MNIHNAGLMPPDDTGAADCGDVPFQVVPGRSGRRLVLLCDHASNRLPKAYGMLGLAETELQRHIGYDIGVKDVVLGLAEALGASAVLSNFSRLLIDPNRGLDDPTLIMQISDGAVVPGNARINEAERQKRIAEFYQPYHAAIDRQLDGLLADGQPPLILSIHSFTECWRGIARPWHAGVLWQEGWEDFPQALITALAEDKSLIVGDNQPYKGGLEGDTLYTHGALRGLPHALLELRQDLIDDAKGITEWVERLTKMLPRLVEMH